MKKKAATKKKKPLPKKKKNMKKAPVKHKAVRAKLGKIRSGLNREKPDARSLALLAAEAAFDKKGFDVMVLDVRGHSPIADMMVIVSGRSSTHVHSISDNIEKTLINKGFKASRRERGALRDATWILLDFFDVLVHVLVNEERAQYQLESLYPAAKIIAQFHD
jgi:ribosome-associated protein